MRCSVCRPGDFFQLARHFTLQRIYESRNAAVFHDEQDVAADIIARIVGDIETALIGRWAAQLGPWMGRSNSLLKPGTNATKTTREDFEPIANW